MISLSHFVDISLQCCNTGDERVKYNDQLQKKPFSKRVHCYPFWTSELCTQSCVLLKGMILLGLCFCAFTTLKKTQCLQQCSHRQHPSQQLPDVFSTHTLPESCKTVAPFSFFVTCPANSLLQINRTQAR